MNEKYKGWAIAVLSINGPLQVSILGRRTYESGPSLLPSPPRAFLTDAIEVRQALAQNPDNPRQMQMIRNGVPCMFLGSLDRIEVEHAIAWYDLGSLSDADVAVIDELLKEAENIRAALRPIGVIQTPSIEILRRIQGA
jgi:hypothetical protein